MSEIRAVKEGRHITLSNPKQKEAAEFDPMHLVLSPHEGSAVIAQPGERETENLTETENKVLVSLRETFGETIAVTTPMLAEATKMSRTSCWRAVNRLVMDGALVNVGTARRPAYQLSSSSGEEG